MAKLDLDVFFPKSTVFIHFPGDFPIDGGRPNVELTKPSAIDSESTQKLEAMNKDSKPIDKEYDTKLSIVKAIHTLLDHHEIMAKLRY